MELRITGRHAHLGAEVTDYANEKLGPLSRYYDRTRVLEVVFEKNHLGWKVEAIAHLQKGAPLVATVHHKDALAAIDVAHDKLERLLTKEKDRRTERRRREADAPAPLAGPAAASEEE